jgi:DNA-binding Lrp family transcriptional regulator
MPKAYVLINCELGYESKIIKELKEVPNVVQAHGIYGIYDIIAEVRYDTIANLQDIVTSIRTAIGGILSTNTLIIVEGQG